jgi:hypothetical protein
LTCCLELAVAARNRVERVVVANGVVMEQREPFDARFLRHPQRILDRAMAPRGLRGELFKRVLSIVHEQVGAIAERKCRIGDVVPTVVGLLVITQVGDGAPAQLTR